MQDSSAAGYAHPEGAGSNPYPALSDNGLKENSAPLEAPEIDTALHSSNIGTGFGSLEDYYKLGQKALLNLSLLKRSTTEARRWEDPNAGIAYDKTSSQARPSTAGDSSTPFPSDTRLFALPGFHYLPENDRLDSSTRQTGQTHLASSVESTPASPPERARGSGRRSSGRRGWKQALKGTDHAALFKTPRLSRQAGGTKPARGRGRAKHVDPGREYRDLQSQATTEFLNGDLERARELASAALKVNPEVWSSYALMSQIFEQQGLEHEAVQALAAGAPVKRDPETWVEVATRMRALKGENMTDAQREFILKLFEEALKLDSRNISARRARMELYSEVGSWHKARKECATILALKPDKLDILWQYSKLCDKAALLDDIRGAIEFYDKAFRMHADNNTFGPADEQWDHLNMYLEMITKIGPPAKGLYELKRIARWFLGRKEDAFWDQLYLQDDREFDEGPERRIYVPQVQSGAVVQDASRYGLGLPIDLRVKLGVFRLQMGSGDHPEAFRHFEHIRRTTDAAEVEPLLDLFLEVANNLRIRFMYGAAVEYYDRVRPFSDTLDREYWMNLAQCCREVGRNRDAEDCYKKVISADDQEVQARINLIKVYEATAQSVKALPFADQLIQIGRSETLRNANLATYVTACKRMRKIALRRIAQKDAGVQSESDLEIPSDEEDTDDESPEVSTPKQPVKRRPKAQQKLQKLAAKPSADQPAPPVCPPIAVDPMIEDRDQDSSSEDEDIDAGGSMTPEAEAQAEAEAEAEAAHEPTFTRGKEYLASLREQKERVQMHYAKVTELWPLAKAHGDPTTVHQWVQHAAAMVNDFKLMKEFYPYRTRDKLYTGLRTGIDTESRNMVASMDAIRKKLLEDAANLGQVDCTVANSSTARAEFQGISFAEWHRVFSNLALQYAQRSDQTQCYYILEKVLMPANVFRDDLGLNQATLSVSLCCALMFNDTRFVLDLTKRLGGPHGTTAATQLLAAGGRLGHGEVPFYGKKTQNLLSAAIEEQEYLAMPPEARGEYEWDKSRKERLDERASQDVVTQLDPGMLTTYAHTIGNNQHGNANNSSLPYLLRALAMEPDNLVINLSIGTAYVVQAMRKAPKVNQYDIAQGISFIYRYYDLRVAGGNVCHVQEAEYNLGRMWVLLKMIHLAVPAYERVLELSPDVQREAKRSGDCATEDYAQEAAVALQHTYAAAGNEDAARNITEEWLVL